MSSNSSAATGKGVSASTPTDSSGKKVRKPYTITKSRESWTEEEHDKFLEALQLFDRDWKKIEDFVGSKTVIQIRSYAQKYFLKIQKNGTISHVPPPRPKRKASHPYPQKASKNVLLPLQESLGYPSSLSTLPPGYPPWEDNHMMINSSSIQTMSSKEEFGNLHGAEGKPDFAEVYNFIGSVFDPEIKGHMQKLKEMDPINFETVLLLMRNLTINLSSPEFEPVRRSCHTMSILTQRELLEKPLSRTRPVIYHVELLIRMWRLAMESLMMLNVSNSSADSRAGRHLDEWSVVFSTVAFLQRRRRFFHPPQIRFHP